MEILIITLLIIIVLYIIYTINKFIYLKKRVERSKAIIDVFLKERFDLIPNLVETVKGYTKYEKETLNYIIELRENFRVQVNENVGNELNKYYKELLAVVENYPELKAGENFLNLQKSLEKIEKNIAAARRIYINDITNYNTLVESIPSNLIAGIFNFKKFFYPLFEMEEVNISF